jgi:hypothetical protein
MPRKDSEERLRYQREYYYSHKKDRRLYKREYRRIVKLEVLTHYGPEGLLGCCWPECHIDDVDILTLDHINHDGAKERNSLPRNLHGGVNFYAWVIKNGFPAGYQTLCANHQLKKEILHYKTRPNR